ncbi:uncharacterized protein LOC128882998 [Hylaeus volcanicus]|uniref:uncharacterized protein LOC128882998 n=1 Tax=Hylaeus volcanicus TaxID=313075 RepID=UPI0023B8816C|nr:uncharacterized protein LOC128882998 [Hylaeus volcanicus]
MEKNNNVWIGWEKEMTQLVDGATSSSVFSTYDQTIKKNEASNALSQVSFNEYFTYYESSKAINNPNNPYLWILLHRNGVLLIGFSVLNDLLVDARNRREQNEQVFFKTTYPSYIQDKQISGKRHHGATHCDTNLVLCTVSLCVQTQDIVETLKSLHVKCPVFGKIVDYNSHLGTFLNAWLDTKQETNLSPFWIVMIASQSQKQIEKTRASLKTHEYQDQTLKPFPIHEAIHSVATLFV